MTHHRFDWKIAVLGLWMAGLTLAPRPSIQVDRPGPVVTVEVVHHESAASRRRQAMADLARGRAFATLAATELAKAQDEAALPLLIAHARTSPRDLQGQVVREACLQALGRYRAPRARRVLRELAGRRSPDRGVRYAAVRSLRRQLGAADIPVLREALRLGLDDDDGSLVDEAARALIDLGATPTLLEPTDRVD